MAATALPMRVQDGGVALRGSSFFGESAIPSPCRHRSPVAKPIMMPVRAVKSGSRQRRNNKSKPTSASGKAASVQTVATETESLRAPDRATTVREPSQSAQELTIKYVRQHAESIAASGALVNQRVPDEKASALLENAYQRCGTVCAEYAKTFYLGTQLMTPERRRAVWAIYVWCRRTDELVDGPNAPHISPEALDRWEQRLEDLYDGRPYDLLDAALSDTVEKYPVDIQPFRDMVDGMRMDLRKRRYANFDELYEYCYKVAGTVGVMTVPVMGVDAHATASLPDIYQAALSLGIANQLTNILRDVGEDARRNRIYLPLEDLARFGITEEDVLSGVNDDRWKSFMKFQIARARQYFNEAEAGASQLERKSRWPVWASLILYRGILDAIERNDFDSFTRRAFVPKWQKLVTLPFAWLAASPPPPKLKGASLF
eukprot:jgi/Chlat1/1929/Chrsp153S02240